MKKYVVAWVLTITCGVNGEVAKSIIATPHVYVIDKISREPIANASVKAWFEVDIGWRAWTESAPIITSEAVTDKSGRCDLSGETNTGDVSVNALKEGTYYGSWENYKYSRNDLTNCWLPNNHVITIALQRVEHPIPLFVRRIEQELFSTNDFFKQANNKLELDLFKGDWLPPVGTGSVADIVFQKKYIKEGGKQGFDYKGRKYLEVCEMSVCFLGKDNGLVPVNVESTCGIRLRKAPEDGYMPEVGCFTGYTGRVISSREENKCYYFRIRTKRNEKGEIVFAYYGKIYADIGLSSDFLIPEFLYYLNTTPLDRNLEWDMKTNLCPVETRTYPLEP